MSPGTPQPTVEQAISTIAPIREEVRHPPVPPSIIVPLCAAVSWFFAAWISDRLQAIGVTVGTFHRAGFDGWGFAGWVTVSSLFARGVGLPNECDSRMFAAQASILTGAVTTVLVLAAQSVVPMGPGAVGAVAAATCLAGLVYACSLRSSAPRILGHRLLFLLGDIGEGGAELVMTARRTGWSVQHIDEVHQAVSPFGHEIAESVLVPAEDRIGELTPESALTLGAAGISIAFPDEFAERRTGRVLLEGHSMMRILQSIGRGHRERYHRVQRGFDIVAGLLLACIALPIAIVLVPLNTLWNRGPLLYRQPRVGYLGREFMMLKFRTMVPQDSTAWTSDHDARITLLGKWLRHFHVDELPQAWNIVRGDLSLVGPRPEQPAYTEQLATTLPLYKVRLFARPGLTGWAQIRSGYAASEEETADKLRHDLYYVKNQSLRLDATIVLRTVMYLFKPKSR